MIAAIVCAEGERGKSPARGFNTVAEFIAYRQGVEDGSAAYGAGSCFAATRDDMEQFDDERERTLAHQELMKIDDRESYEQRMADAKEMDAT